MNIREKILVVEDEKSISHFISTVLNSHGYEAIQARSGTEALSILVFEYTINKFLIIHLISYNCFMICIILCKSPL